jgi:hypothetical protein
LYKWVEVSITVFTLTLPLLPEYQKKLGEVDVEEVEGWRSRTISGEERRRTRYGVGLGRRGKKKGIASP